MNFSGFAPHEFGRFSSLVEQDDPTVLPVGLAAAARNVTFHLTSVRTRDGLQTQFQTATQDQPVTGLASLKYQQSSGDTQAPIVFDFGGRLYVESPAGSGSLTAVATPGSFAVTRIQTSGGTSVFKYLLDLGASVNGASYVMSLMIKNQGTQPVFVSSNINTSSAIAPGAWQLVTLNFAGNGTSNVQFLLQANSVPDSMDVLAYAPFAARLADRINLIPQANQNFSGWQAWSGATVTVTQGQPVTYPLVTLPASAHMQVAPAYNRGYLAFSDLKSGQALPGVYDLPSGNLDPYTLRPVGDRWKANTSYQAGETITPASGGTSGNGHTYRCTATGTSGSAEPVFSPGDGATISDSTVTWKEVTAHAGTYIDSIPNTFFTLNRVAGAGSYASGRDVYIAVTITNGNGESLLSTTNVVINTATNDRVQVVINSAFPSWLAGLSAPFAPTTVNIYAADVATGTAAPAAGSYHLAASGVATGSTNNVDSTGAGAAPPTANAAAITPVGNICFGVRFAVVLFKNRNGSISGMTEASVLTINIPSNGRQLWMGNLPAGPANTAARVVCFTVSGGSTAGDYFYIPSNDSVSGIPITSTVVNDNTTTTATFNFTDVYLLASTKVTSFFRKIQAPACVDIYFSQTTGRMVMSGATGFPSGWLISLPDDPESFYGDTGIVQAGENDGQRAIAWREFRGTSYGFKERSGYVIEPGATDPSTWQVTKRWDGVGPAGPRAVDVASSFMVFVHRSGAYVFTGDTPVRISKEIPKTWRSINWDYAHLIWVQIDEESQEVRIGVPLNDSTVPNAVLKCNYEEAPDFAAPIYFSPFVGKEIATGSSRKWSVDDIAAFVGIRAERRLSSSIADAPTRQSQLLFASAGPDGAINAIIPGTFNDNGGGIDCVYETVSTQDLLRVNQLGGISVNATGFGDLNVSVVYGRKSAIAPDGRIDLKPLKLADTQDKAPPGVGARGQNERFRLRFSNGKQPNFWFDLKYAILYARPVATSR